METFYSLQGEGRNMGRPAWFIRIGGCDNACSWCDIRESWKASLYPLHDTDELIRQAVVCPAKAVVVTGGEPLLCNLDYLCSQLKMAGLQTFLETSGSEPMSGKWDWICLSPKKNHTPDQLYFKLASELKMIIQKPEDFLWAEENAAKVNPQCQLLLQPEWSAYHQIIPHIIDYILKNPRWSVSLQAHKFMRIP